MMTWLVWPIARPTRAAMHWLTGAKTETGPSEEEVMVFARLARRHGRVRGEEQTWVQNALLLDRVRAKELMTPRRVVEMLSASTTVDEAIARTDRWVHSRVPVFADDNPDEILGIVYRREVFDAAVAGAGGRTLGELRKRLVSVPGSMPAHELLRLFLQRRRHLVAVVDEYGGIQGIVTLEDVLEALLGEEIVDEHDEIVDLQQHARDSNPHAEPDPRPPAGPDEAR
jgi:CBS domain containing-hemolysin-like protein